MKKENISNLNKVGFSYIFLCIFILLHFTQNFLNMEFALKYGVRELLRHEKIPETHVLATLLAGTAWLFEGKQTLAY